LLHSHHAAQEGIALAQHFRTRIGIIELVIEIRPSNELVGHVRGRQAISHSVPLKAQK